MTSVTTRLLLVEDTPTLARSYIQYLRNEPYLIDHVETGREAFERLGRESYGGLLLDLVLPDMNGLDILRRLRDGGNEMPVVVITANGSIQVAVSAMQTGADDFLVKPFNADRLKVTLRNSLDRHRLAGIVETYRAEIDVDHFEGFIGASLRMQAVYRMIESAAASKATIFITGESGTGKEVCAQAIRARGPRADKPFVALNCAAIPRELMESEIFGHVKGAFTGALQDRVGAARRAHGGTLFLDEVCEMNLDLQAKLLRFLQGQTFSPVGAAAEQTVDIRLICATNKDPASQVRAGRFREDLYYRLHVIPIDLPPLRDRADDIAPIARHVLARTAAEEGKTFTAFSPAAEAMLLNHAWPGNVREMENVVRNIVVLNDGPTVTAEMLPPALSGAVAEPGPAPASPAVAAAPDLSALSRAIRPLAEQEREIIEAAVRQCGGNVRTAAALLGIAPQTIYRKRAAWQATAPD